MASVVRGVMAPTMAPIGGARSARSRIRSVAGRGASVQAEETHHDDQSNDKEQSSEHE